jgi:hypothetical protein
MTLSVTCTIPDHVSFLVSVPDLVIVGGGLGVEVFVGDIVVDVLV